VEAMTSTERDSEADAGGAAPRTLLTMAGRGHGGAEIFFCRLAAALAGKGLEVSAVTRPQPAVTEALSAAGIGLQTSRFRRRFDVLTRRRVRQAIERRRPDVVLAFMQRAAMLTPAGRHRLIGRLGGAYPLRPFLHCDHLVVPAPGLYEHVLAAGWPAARLSLLPNFLADRHADPAPPALRPSDAPLVLGLGRLHRNKGFDLLLRALAAVPGVQLWLAGDGPEAAALERLAAELELGGRVRFLGWQADPLPLLRAVDLLVVPSRVEPFGNVVLEAWMAGCPVLASDTAGPAWLIRDGVGGRLAPAGEAEALVGPLRALLGDAETRRRLAAGGRAAYLAGFMEERGVTGYLELFRRLAPRP